MNPFVQFLQMTATWCKLHLNLCHWNTEFKRPYCGAAVHTTLGLNNLAVFCFVIQPDGPCISFDAQLMTSNSPSSSHLLFCVT